ncbi:hypothetical protein Q8A67_021985 [Cirrhinus molitorella]|uniref:Uncharacterized protein n=1 Tax=Cirrhinus molitorella TaxID=172907 RepID=A0AA88PB07_9TELE|nr:hypothetical protein Q8A67_021985 [Cirrhinus molitorella]
MFPTSPFKGSDHASHLQYLKRKIKTPSPSESHQICHTVVTKPTWWSQMVWAYGVLCERLCVHTVKLQGQSFVSSIQAQTF